MEKEKIIITIRVPFCTGHPVFLQHKSYGENIATLQRYRMALEKEIASAAAELDEYDIRAVHIVEGSMGLFGPGALDDFLRALRKALPMAESAQWILDMMPGDCSDLMMVGPLNVHLDRINLIVPAGNKEELFQTKCSFSMNIVDHTLAYLSTAATPERCAATLIGIPGQTPETLTETLRRMMLIAPTDIHLKPFTNNRLSDSEAEALCEETPWETLYAAADEFLREQGLMPYGPDHHYAIPGHELAEAEDEAAEYSAMGFGVGAVTRMEGISYHNTLNLKLYVDNSDDPTKIARLD